MMIVYCIQLPGVLFSNVILSTDSIQDPNKITKLNDTTYKMLGKDMGRVCFNCRNDVISATERCFDVEGSTVYFIIEPSNTKFYYKGSSLIVTCVVVPDYIKQKKKITDITIKSDKKQLLSIDQYSMQIPNLNLGRICFSCESHLIDTFTKCLDYFDQPIVIKIIPNDTLFYCSSRVMTVICDVRAEISVPSNILDQVIFTFDNGSSTQTSNRSVNIDGKDRGVICFKCGHPQLSYDFRCYKFLNTDDLMINILPNYKIYLPNTLMTIECKITPVQFYDKAYKLNWLYINATIENQNERKILIKGVDRVRIFFKCGHPEIMEAQHYYDYYGKSIHSQIYPNDTDLYVRGKELTVYCKVYPSEIIDNNLLNDFKLSGNYTRLEIINDLVNKIPADGYGGICFICGNPLIKNTTHCYKYFDGVFTMKIMPNQVYYYSGKEVSISCYVHPLRLLVEIRHIDFIWQNSTYDQIKRRIITIKGENKGTICFSCGHWILSNTTRCYKYADISNLKIIIKPEYLVFLYKVHMEVTCLVTPAPFNDPDYSINFIYVNATKSTEFPKSVTITGEDTVRICFICGNPNIFEVQRCYDCYDKLVYLEIQPNYTTVYLEQKVMNVTCSVIPNELVTKYRFSGHNLSSEKENVLKRFSVTILEINGNDNGEICFKCEHKLLKPVETCYKYFAGKISLSIQPNYTDIYFPISITNISCLTEPITIQTNSLITDILLTGNNLNLIRVDNQNMIIPERNLGQVCFQCSSQMIQTTNKCYDFYNRPFSITIKPDNTEFYFYNIFMNITCEVEKKELINRITNIDFVINNSSFKQTSTRLITLTGEDKGFICFKCGYILTTFDFRCYDFIDTRNLLMEITPSYEVYYINVDMLIVCDISPDFFKDPKFKIKLTSINATVVFKSILSLLIQGKDTRTICFQCGNPDFKVTIKCYVFSNIAMRLEIAPSDVDIYLPNKQLDVSCEKFPENVTDKDLINNIKFDSNSTSIQVVDQFHISLNGKGETACFICGSSIVRIVKKCYTYFDNPFQIIIQPNYTLYYYSKKIVNITCFVTPKEILHRVKVIDFIFNNSTYVPVALRVITIYGHNKQRICFSCGHVLLAIDFRCYDYIDITNLNIQILPNYIVFLENQNMDVTCVFTPYEKFKDPSFEIIFQWTNATGNWVDKWKITINGSDRSTICFRCGNPFSLEITKCYDYFGGDVKLFIHPNYTSIYFPNYLMDVYCQVVPNDLISLMTDITITANSTNIISLGQRHLQITGAGKELICITCGNLVLKPIQKCYQYFGKDVALHIEPNNTDIYVAHQGLNVFCNVHPKEIDTNSLIQDIILIGDNKELIQNDSRRMMIPGKNLGKVCFQCSSKMVLNVPAKRCYDYFEGSISLEIIPNTSSIYPQGRLMDLYCKVLPQSAIDKIRNIEFIGNSSNLRVISKLHLQILGDNEGTICLRCQHPIANESTRCYEYYGEPYGIYITPNDTLYYYTFREMEILCLFYPNDLINRVTEIDFIFNNSTFVNSGPRRIVLFGNNMGYICFSCGNDVLGGDTRCYNYIDIRDLEMKIMPLYKIYFANIEMDIECLVKPEFLQNETFGIDFRFWNATTIRVSQRLIRISGTDMALICFTCGNKYILIIRKCYEYFSAKVQFSIHPNYTKIYLPQKKMDVECSVDPVQIITLYKVRDIDFQADKKGVTNIVYLKMRIPGDDLGTICFKCGHKLFPYVDRCYSYYSKSISIHILPDDTLYYYSMLTMNIECNVLPDEIYLNSLVVIVDFIYQNATGADVSPRLIKIDGTDVGRICFTCGHIFLVIDNRCYDFIDRSKLNITILPARLVYFSNVEMEVECVVYPKFFNNESFEIRFLFANASLASRTYKLIRTKGIDTDTIGFVCGNKYLPLTARTYNYFDSKSVNVTIYPQYREVYFKKKGLNVTCVVKPDYVLNASIINDIEFTADNANAVKADRYYYIIPIDCTVKICFICKNKIFSSENKCYDYFDDDIYVDIRPNNTQIYLPRRIFNVRCVILPEILITNNIVKNFFFSLNNTILPGFDYSFSGSISDLMCFTCGHSEMITVSRCYKSFDLNVSFYIKPDGVKLHTKLRSLKVTCHVLPLSIITDDLITDIELTTSSSDVLRIGPREMVIPPSNKDDICFFCGSSLFEKVTKCFLYYGEDVYFWIEPNFTDIYLRGVNMKVACLVYPQTLLTLNYINSTEFYMNGTRIHSGEKELTGEDLGTLCFSCGHQLFSLVWRCYFYYDKIINVSILPENITFYRLFTPLTVQCSVKPDEILKNNLIRGIDFYEFNSTYISKTVREIIVKTKDIGLICFSCGHVLIQPGSRCYEEQIKVFIEPSFMNAYLDKVAFDVTCNVPANKAHRTSELVDLELTSDVTLERNDRLSLQMPGKDIGTVCFNCTNNFVYFGFKCFQFFGYGVEFIINPDYTEIYLPGVVMNITCDVNPPTFKRDNIKDIGFTYNNSTVNLTTLNLIIHDGRNDGTICFECGHPFLSVTTKCYEYFEKEVVSIIEPEYKKYYLRNRKLTFRCKIEPPEIITNGLIEGIDFFYNNSTFKPSGVREITIDGSNVGTICFRCGREFFNPPLRCYEYFDDDLKFVILPDVEIYLVHSEMEIQCSVTPSLELYLLVNSISFTFYNATVIYKTNVLIRISDTNDQIICFKCGHKFFRFAEKCYQPFDKTIRLSIVPNHLKIYYEKITTNVTCNVSPEEALNKMKDILLTVDNPLVSRINSMTFAMPQYNLGTICFKCGNEIVSNVKMCYEFYDKKINLIIQPNYTDIYVNNKSLSISCEVQPSELITRDLLSRIRLYSLNNTDASDVSFEIIIGGKDMGRLCFRCGYTFLMSPIKCYDYYDLNITIRIIPFQRVLYFHREYVDIECVVFPKEIMKTDMKDGLEFTFNNSTFNLVNKRTIRVYDSKIYKFCLKCSHPLLVERAKCYYNFKSVKFHWYHENKNVYMINETIGCVYPRDLDRSAEVTKYDGPGNFDMRNPRNISLNTTSGGMYSFLCTLKVGGYESVPLIKSLTIELIFLPTKICILPFLPTPRSIIRCGHNGYPTDEVQYEMYLFSGKVLLAHTKTNFLLIPYFEDKEMLTVICSSNFTVKSFVKYMMTMKSFNLTFVSFEIILLKEEDYECANIIGYSFNDSDQLSPSARMFNSELTVLQHPSPKPLELVVALLFGINTALGMGVFFILLFNQTSKVSAVRLVMKHQLFNEQLTSISNRMIQSHP